jgi:LAS superfamily LD-carboxypeptidase LdcB
MDKFMLKYSNTLTLIIIVVIVGGGVIVYFLYNLSNNIKLLENNLSSTTAIFESKLSILQSDLATTTKTSANLSQQLVAQQNKSESLDQTLNGITNTVGTLEKLSKTDKELLQKYSKVYFLNENYVPLQLAPIDQRYLYKKDEVSQFHALAMIYLTRMLADSVGASSTALVVSAYRSFGTQAALKSDYLVTYGTGANKFSSDQGYSEHQLGTAVDLGTPYPDTLLVTSFENTRAFNWLNSNAYKYGFILSYPKNNAYYQYEPWHWRFVGVKLATYLHSQNKHFYDLDQREIDAYLVSIFD